MSFFSEAMHSLNPELVWKHEGNDPTNESEFNSRVSIQTSKDNSIVLFEKSISTTEINWEDISNEMTRIQNEYDAQDYARKREAEYPTIAELTVALYDVNDRESIDAKRAAVKAKYPKPE